MGRIKLSPTNVAHDKQREFSSCPGTTFDLCRKALPRVIECIRDGLQGIGVVDMPNVVDWEHFVLPLFDATVIRNLARARKNAATAIVSRTSS